MDLTFLAVHAHPDDEASSTGGIYRVLADEGVRTVLVTCTNGEFGDAPGGVKPDADHHDGDEVAKIRAVELDNAVKILGIERNVRFGYRDSGMMGWPQNDDPESFWATPVEDVARRLADLIEEERPQVIVTYNEHGFYGHPDHIQAHRVTLLAVEAAHSALYPDLGPGWRVSKLYYTAFPRSEARRIAELAKTAGMKPPFGDTDPDSLEFITPDDWVTTAVNCRDQLGRKRQALAAHRSQLTEEFAMLSVPEEVLREHFPSEFFQLVVSRVPTGLPETDVFAGLADGEAPEA